MSQISDLSEAKTLGEAVRWLREKRKLSLRELAAQIGVSAPFLSDIEHNRRGTDRLPQLARALGVRADELEALSGKLPGDLKEWIADNPSVVRLLKDLRDSGRPVAEARALLHSKSFVKK